MKNTTHVSAQCIFLVFDTFASQGHDGKKEADLGKSRSPWHPLAEMVISLSLLQHSGETLEQRKHIESSRLFFSLRRTIIFRLIEDRSAYLKMAAVDLVLSADIISEHIYIRIHIIT